MFNTRTFIDEVHEFLSCLNDIQIDNVYVLSINSRALLYTAKLYIDTNRNECELKFKEWIAQNSELICSEDESLFTKTDHGEGRVAQMITGILQIRSELPTSVHSTIWQWLQYFDKLVKNSC